nr:phosphotransferase [Salirhabdus salicampi]
MDENDGKLWCLTPWVEGKSLSFKEEKNRDFAVRTLTTFHRDVQGIVVPTYRKPITFSKKMEKRLRQFIKTKALFHDYGYLDLYEQIVKHSHVILEQMEQLNWHRLESIARKKRYWIHGDCASHNFIVQNHNVFMIDFDLLSPSPYEYEWIQLAQRFMDEPTASVYTLLRYQIFQRLLERNRYFYYGILFPNDLIREWMYAIKNKKRRIGPTIQKFDEKWQSRMEFVAEVNSMI